MIKFLNDRDRDKVNFSTTGHTHKNYEELNKIKELNGKITYDGKNIRMVDDGRVISKIIEEDGYINIDVDGEEKRVDLIDIHLEEDSASLDHYSYCTLIDYNRAGVPLLETVTKPCLHSS